MTAIAFFFIDSLSTQYCVGFLSSTINALLDHSLVSLTTFLFTFGFLSPLVGVPYTIFPVACAFVYNSKLSSMTWAMIYSFLLSSTAPLLGGAVAFWFGSTCLAEWAIQQKERGSWKEKWRALDTIFDDPRQSIKMQTLLRLSPLIPAAALNYILGATSNCKFEHFALSFFLGGTPYVLPLAYIGCLFTDATDLEDNDDLSVTSPVGIAFAVVGLVCTAVLTLTLTVYTRRKLDELVEEKRETLTAAVGVAGLGGEGSREAERLNSVV